MDKYEYIEPLDTYTKLPSKEGVPIYISKRRGLLLGIILRV